MNNKTTLQAIEKLRGDIARLISENLKIQEETQARFFLCTMRFTRLRPNSRNRGQPSASYKGKLKK